MHFDFNIWRVDYTAIIRFEGELGHWVIKFTLLDMCRAYAQ